MMKIGLIDADLMDNGTRHPNLALMKIAGYYKELGYDVRLIYKSYNEIEQYDKVFISKVFNFTNVPEGITKLENVEYGGTGFFEDGGKNLPDKIEHHMPYYDLYKEYIDEQLSNGRKRIDFSDYLDYSIGFTTRGCFRKCSFCVNKKYKRVKVHSPIDEFFDESRPYIYLWDDNILAYSNWESILDSIESKGRQFQFRQGLDLRLMTDRKAKRFNNTSYQGDFIFAFDSLKDKHIISEKVQLWKRYSSKVCKMYVLCAFESQDEKDIETVFERIKILMKYGSLPYIMRYESYNNSKFRGMYIELARWCNQPQFFKKKSFREFCEANQAYKKNQDTYCSSYRAMIEFEKEFPEIAQKYFDLKFENENMYKIQYGFGRKYQNKPLCKDCKKEKLCWNDILQNKGNKDIEEKFIELYFTKEIDILCLEYENSECNVKSEEAAKYLKNILLKYTINEIINILKNSQSIEEVNKLNIPIINKLSNVSHEITNVIVNSEYKKVTYEEIESELGYISISREIGKNSFSKYLKDNVKLMTLMDLTHINKHSKLSYIKMTKLGDVLYELNKEEKIEIYKKLLLRIPIISNGLIHEFDIVDEYIESMFKNDKKRIKSSIKNIISFIKS